MQPGAPGEGGRELSDDDVAGLEAPEHTAVDTAFMQGMLVHHAQALEMTALVDERTDSEDMPLLAERITVSQEAEIAPHRAVADRPGRSGARPRRPRHARAHARHGDTRAAGRAGDASGPAFDALFLELMIAHHQGALTMVDELYTAGGGIEPAVDAFAREVEADQSIEIGRMTDMQSARGIVTASGRDPARHEVRRTAPTRGPSPCWVHRGRSAPGRSRSRRAAR